MYEYEKYIIDLLELIADVNPTEIADQVERGNLQNWCNGWSAAAKKAIIKLKL